MTDQLSDVQQTKEPQMSVLVMISQGRRLRGCKNGTIFLHFFKSLGSHGWLLAAMTGYNPFTLEATSDPEVLPLDLVVGSVGSELDERNPA